jgi:hypothetical protein
MGSTITIRPQSNHSDNEDRSDLQQGGVLASTWGPLANLRIKRLRLNNFLDWL